MATDAATIATALKASIKAAMAAAAPPCAFNMTGGWVDCAVDALATGIANGLYPELQNLDDLAGTPPSVGHV